MSKQQEQEEKQVRAQGKYIRISPIKARKVVRGVKGKDIALVQARLKALPNKAAELILKILNSAVANAVNNAKWDKDKIYIKNITVNEGPKFVRYQAKARGRINRIIKRLCHIEVTVGEIGG